MKIHVYILWASAFILSLAACKDDDDVPVCDDCPSDDTITGPYSPQAYDLALPFWMPTPVLPAENPMTVDGVALGRMLFYDPILSSDSTMSCASCHSQELNFTDGKAVSRGVLGIDGKRSSMAIVNMAFNNHGFFWDGRAATLEDQALLPVEDHTELNEEWDNVEKKLRRHNDYPALFRKAFGIERKSQITKELAVKAIAQFERSIVSYNSKFDRVVWLNDGWLSDEEERGRQLFFFETSIELGHPGCTHCHPGPLFTDNTFRNNGLDNVPNLGAFQDKGLGGVNGNIYDNGKFRAPTLRNIELTAPYMHDGRFQTLEQVLEHYASGGHGVENEDVNIQPFDLTEGEKQDLIAFLKTLTDTSFINNPKYSDPFQ
jgi:cytochrome c peroxidase